ncbi:hypothetical protein BHE90_001202 [Fusarium euwallaceae]|uniref:Uncharacterized protein n=2 Tax=Fusarium solani species complex TaxID=232080 RepID=A0A430M8N6_9HYPO|nr:hypothetical protein CEP51_011761 [Fusarium floridanum]RTE84322.1 hypothetical protein BHE90_001202 [Fusarium euwallaceae]
MSPPSHTIGQCQAKSDSMLANTNSVPTSTPPPPEPPSSPRRTTPKLDSSSISKPSTSPTNESQRPNISPEVVRGLHLLSLDMPQGVAVKVATAYTNMLPMDRFLAETCNVDGGAPMQGIVGSSQTSSCRANAGSE